MSSSVKVLKKLRSLSATEQSAFLDSFDHVMVDCDGCIWSLLEPIAGAGDGLHALQSQLQKRIIYVSNNSVRPVENFRAQLQKVGLQLDETCLVNSVIAIVHYLRKRQFQGMIYVIGSKEMRNRLRNEGLQVIFGVSASHSFIPLPYLYNLIFQPDDPLDEHFETLLGAISDNLPVKAVIFDVEFNFNYVKYMRAQKYLNDPECILIAGATDRRMSLGKNLNFAGPSPFLDLLQSHQPPVVLGKPGDALAEVLMDKFKVEDPNRVLFIGDTLEQDILFGNKNHFQTMLVLTGATSQKQLDDQTEDSLIPDYYTESLADLVDVVNGYKGKDE